MRFEPLSRGSAPISRGAGDRARVPRRWLILREGHRASRVAAGIGGDDARRSNAPVVHTRRKRYISIAPLRGAMLHCCGAASANCFGAVRMTPGIRPGGLGREGPFWNALRYSTNKSSFTSGEYHFPLYGWLPDAWRYRMRIARQGEEIMKLGIDFNQFTHAAVRRVSRSIGFREVYDRIDIYMRFRASQKHGVKYRMIGAVAGVRFLKELALLFSSGTLFICIK